MLAQKFFKIFPPPKFLNIPYAGLDISDDAVRCIEYTPSRRGLSVHRYGTKNLAPGVVEGGKIQDPKALTEAIASLCKGLKVYAVKASLPEEKMYLFQTNAPSGNAKAIRQNIEFKLEENVPLSPTESIFFFEPIPKVVPKEGGTAISVSVAPRSLVQAYLDVIKAAGVTVLSFEVQAKAIAYAVVPRGSTETEMIVSIMNNKTGIYIVCGGVVCFTSTVAWGNQMLVDAQDTHEAFAGLQKHMEQVEGYWSEHGQGQISTIIFVGRSALTDGLLSECSTSFTGKKVCFEMGKVWQNAFSYDNHVPPVPYDESLDYAAAAGLALPTFI